MATALFEPDPLEKLNWLIHLQHVRGEITKCKELIAKEIVRSGGKHEYAQFKKVKNKAKTALYPTIYLILFKGVILRDEDKIQEALESFQICHKLNSDNSDNIKEVAKCLWVFRKSGEELWLIFEIVDFC